ncbi:uncharacterized protein LOC108459172 [Gossypium arboreum]|uniref:uncharacterized protein LOC108459172 n=1 Tax=Gossypium arboreum TaxID=29729 RepID=UPI000819109E|nr:uncharacterized protein LOC108459172 [Gossypium arboreum]
MEAETNFSLIAPPIFDGDNYQIWTVRMETYLEAIDIWEPMEEDYEIPTLPTSPTVAQIKTQKEKKKRKSKAKTCLFTAVSPTIFTRIMSLKEKMKEIETVNEYSERLINIVNKVKLLGSSLADSRIVEKILVTIPERF